MIETNCTILLCVFGSWIIFGIVMNAIMAFEEWMGIE